MSKGYIFYFYGLNTILVPVLIQFV